MLGGGGNILLEHSNVSRHKYCCSKPRAHLLGSTAYCLFPLRLIVRSVPSSFRLVGRAVGRVVVVGIATFLGTLLCERPALRSKDRVVEQQAS